MVNDASRRSHDFKDELGGKPEWVGVYCERALKLHPSWKGLSGKAKVKTGIGKSDLPGLQGGPRKRDLCQLLHGARASALSRPRPKRASRPVASVAIHRVAGGREAYTARKQAVKIQLRKPACCDAEAVDKAEGNIRSSDIARSRRDRRSPYLGACFQRDSPGTQESSPSP
jgi:hypothetical protein